MFRARDVLEHGLLTRDSLRSSAWRRLYRGIYADAELPDSFDVRIRGARLMAPTTAAFSGRTAAYLHGVTQLVDREMPVEDSVPAGTPFGPVRGVRVRRVQLPATDVTAVGRFRFTTGLRTALDIARLEPVMDAVSALDVLLAEGVIGWSELSARARAWRATAVRRERGAPSRLPTPERSHSRSLACASSWRWRVCMPCPSSRCGMRTALVSPGWIWPFPIAIEYDGARHAEPGQFAKDRRRLNALVAAGWTVLHVTAVDLRDPVALVGRAEALLAMREFGVVGLEGTNQRPGSPQSPSSRR